MLHNETNLDAYISLQEILSDLFQQWKADLTAALQKDIDDFLEIMELLPCKTPIDIKNKSNSLNLERLQLLACKIQLTTIVANGCKCL